MRKTEAEWIIMAEIKTERISNGKQNCNVLIYSIIKRQNVYVECKQHKQPIDITKFLISWAPFSVNSDGHLHWYLKNRLSNSSRFSAEEASISAPTEPHHDWRATDDARVHLQVKEDVVLGTHAQRLSDFISGGLDVFAIDIGCTTCGWEQSCQDRPAKHKVFLGLTWIQGIAIV